MRVAVIGGTGVVGSHLVAALAAAGHEPVPVARRARAGAVVADVGSPHALEAALAGCDAAVAAFGSLRQGPGASFHDVHVKGMRNLVAACRASRVRRVVHLSALGASPSSRSAFHRAKSAGEDLLRRSLLDWTVVRPSVMFGPGDDFVCPLARLLRRLPVAPLPGRGEARLQPLHAADAARAVLAALERDGTVGQTYELCGPETLTLAEVYGRVMEAAGVHRPKVHVPYLIIEPLTLVFGTLPLIGFTFDQLAVVEEEPREAPGGGLIEPPLTPFSVENLRQAIFGAPAEDRYAAP
jgi:NADH dehydrogenase